MEIIELTRQNIPLIGNILYKLRETCNIEQKDVAQSMGKRASQVSGMENNRKTPGLLNTSEFLGALGGKCRLCILFDRESDGEDQREAIA